MCSVVRRKRTKRRNVRKTKIGVAAVQNDVARTYGHGNESALSFCKRRIVHIPAPPTRFAIRIQTEKSAVGFFNVSDGGRTRNRDGLGARQIGNEQRVADTLELHAVGSVVDAPVSVVALQHIPVLPFAERTVSVIANGKPENLRCERPLRRKHSLAPTDFEKVQKHGGNRRFGFSVFENRKSAKPRPRNQHVRISHYIYFDFGDFTTHCGLSRSNSRMNPLS